MIGDASGLVKGHGDREIKIEPVEEANTGDHIKTKLVFKNGKLIVFLFEQEDIVAVIEEHADLIVPLSQGFPGLGLEHPKGVSPGAKLLYLKCGARGCGLCLDPTWSEQEEAENKQSTAHQEKVELGCCAVRLKGVNAVWHAKELLDSESNRGTNGVSIRTVTDIPKSCWKW